MGAVVVPPQPPPFPAHPAAPRAAPADPSRPLSWGSGPLQPEAKRASVAGPPRRVTPQRPKRGLPGREGLASAPRRAAGGAPAPTWRRGEAQRGQGSGPGRAAASRRSPTSPPAGRAGRESERGAGRSGRLSERASELARLRRAEAGAACPAQTPPPAFLCPPSLRDSPGDAGRRRRVRGLDRAGPAPSRLPHRRPLRRSAAG